MFKSLFIILLTVTAVCLAAVPAYVPKTAIAEDFCTIGCPNCLDAAAGLDTLHSRYHSGEFISLRNYIQAGALSNQWSEALATFYGADLFPNVIFNGTTSITGGGDDVASGLMYLPVLAAKRFAPSPVKMEITAYNASQSTLAGRVTMLSPDFVLNGATLRIFLVENNVSADASHVVREIVTQTFSLSGQNNYADFSAFFTTLPVNFQNFWAAAYLQLPDRTIIQAASTLPQPQFQIRAAFDWSSQIIGPANSNYLSQPVWFLNTGATENFTIRIVKDDGPADWYFNFCDEDGMCYPGNMAHGFTLQSGAYTGYHLNLIVGSSGTAHFRFVIESNNIPAYEIPFSYQTDDTANQDNVLPGATLALLNAYPNPLSGSAVFKVFSPHSANSKRIEIYNIRGQKVHSVSTGALKTGTNEIAFQAMDVNGKPLAAGIYYCRLQGQPAVRKILILNK